MLVSCQLEKTDEYGNMEVCSRVITKTSPPVKARSEVGISIHPFALQPCTSAARLSDGSEFGCTASETHVKGTIDELCRVRSILKAMLFEERKRKVSFHQCLRGTLPGVELAQHNVHSAGCHKVAWSFSPVSQTFSGMGCWHSCGKTKVHTYTGFSDIREHVGNTVS